MAEKHPIREITMYHYTDTISAFPESVLFYSKEDNEKLIEYVSNEPEEVYSEDGKNLYAVTYGFPNDPNTTILKSFYKQQKTKGIALDYLRL